MPDGKSARPWMFFFLDLPYGVSSGFITVTLPFILARAGFSVEATAAVTAAGISGNLWRFVWGPIADLTLSARRWYLLGTILAALSQGAVGFVPLHPGATAWLVPMVLIAQMASTISALPLPGIMAHTLADDAKVTASGWLQAGNLGGAGLGGGAGIWLAAHVSSRAACAGLGLVMLLSAVAVVFVPDVRLVTHERVGARLRLLGRDLWAMIRWPLALFTVIVVSSPIGAAGMTNLWSAVAPDWHATDDQVALVTGVLNGLVSAAGCVLGGWAMARLGLWRIFFGSSFLLGLAAIGMAVGPRTPAAFGAGVLVYALLCGVSYAGFTAACLRAAGSGTATTKYALLASFGNLPVAYMTAFDGWVHDRLGSAWMLHGDGLTAIAGLAVATPILLLILRRDRRAAAPGAT